MEKIVVCVCTRGRPELFKRCINSLARVIKPEGFDLETLVIDNNDEKSADVSDACHATGGAVIRYRYEPTAGLASARNAALETALVMDATWIAFIDDDEVADKLWLVRFMEAIERYAIGGQACDYCGKPHNSPVDAVHGTIRYAYPTASAKWRRRAPWGSWGAVDGAPLDCAGTGNVIFRASLVWRHGLRFNPALNASGGEDTDFFRRFHALGGRIILSTLAIVTEAVTMDRLTLRGHWRKAYRNGHNKARERKTSLRRVVKRGASGALKIAAAPLLIVGGRTIAMKLALSGMLNVAEAAGTIHALRGGKFDYYAKVTGK